MPWYESQEIPILRILTDRGTEYCGKIENHAFELFLSIENIEFFPENPKEGQSFNISTTVTNYGNESVKQALYYYGLKENHMAEYLARVTWKNIEGYQGEMKEKYGLDKEKVKLPLTNLWFSL